MNAGEPSAEFQKHVSESLKDLRFVEQLEQIRMAQAVLGRWRFYGSGRDSDYSRAFREYGVDVDHLPAETSVARLKIRPALGLPLAAALDDWVEVRRNDSSNAAAWNRLVTVARGIDRDRLRDRLRSSWGQKVTGQSQDELRARRVNRRRSAAAGDACQSGTDTETSRMLGNGSCASAAHESAHPSDFWLNLELADAMEHQKDYIGMVRYYTAAVSIRPNSSMARYNLGIAFEHLERIDEAVASYSKAVEIDFTHALSLENFAMSHLSDANWDEPVRVYRLRLAANPNNARTHFLLGFALAKTARWDEAIPCFRKAVELNPKLPIPILYLAISFAKQGDLPHAIDSFREGIEHSPEYFQPFYSNLSWMLAESSDEQLRDAQPAIDAAIRTMQLAPNDGSYAYWYTLGVAHYRHGDWKAAVEALDRPNLNRGWQDIWSLFFLAMAEWRLGHRTEGERWYNTAVAKRNGQKPSAQLLRLKTEAGRLLGLIPAREPMTPREPPMTN